MKTIYQSFTKKQITYIALMFIAMLTYMIFIAVLQYFPELSGLPYALNKAMIGCIILKLIDEFMLYEVSTMQILKQNATAYSLYMLSYALIIALALATA